MLVLVLLRTGDVVPFGNTVKMTNRNYVYSEKLMIGVHHAGTSDDQ